MNAPESLSFWKKQVQSTLDVVMGNPKLTPLILLVLAVVPLLTLAIVVFVTLSYQGVQ